MKTIITIIIALISFSTFSQNTARYVYIVGSANVPGYELKTQDGVIDTSAGEIHSPAMTFFEQNEKLYVGGEMTNAKGKVTIIKDVSIKYETNENNYTTTTLTISGEKFSCSVSTNDGYILKSDKDETTFFDPKLGIWKISKKKK